MALCNSSKGWFSIRKFRLRFITYLEIQRKVCIVRRQKVWRILIQPLEVSWFSLIESPYQLILLSIVKASLLGWNICFVRFQFVINGKLCEKCITLQRLNDTWFQQKVGFSLLLNRYVTRTKPNHVFELSMWSDLKIFVLYEQGQVHYVYFIQ